MLRRLSQITKLRKRHGEPLYVVVVLEIQSKVEHFMAARKDMYVALLYDMLRRSG